MSFSGEFVWILVICPEIQPFANKQRAPAIQ